MMLILFIFAVVSATEYVIIENDETSELNGRTNIVYVLNECVKDLEGYVKMSKDANGNLQLTSYEDETCTKVILTTPLSDIKSVSELPEHIAEFYTGKDCTNLDKNVFYITVPTCQPFNSNGYKYTVINNTLYSKTYLDSECIRPLDGPLRPIQECGECIDGLDEKTVMKCIEEKVPTNTPSNPEFLLSNMFGFLEIVVPLNECFSTGEESLQYTYLSPSIVNACEYSNSYCSGKKECLELTLENFGMEYIKTIPDNIAHAKVSYDKKCEETVDFMVVIFQSKCMSFVDIFGGLDNMFAKRDVEGTLKQVTDINLESLHLKYDIKDNSLYMTYYSDDKCSQKLAMDQQISECDKCVDVESFSGMGGMKRSFMKNSHFLKKAGDEEEPGYMTIICEEYDGVGSTLILFVLAFLFFLF